MPYTSGKLKGQLTAAEIRKLIRGHNKLVSIKIPPNTNRDGLIKLIEDNGYKLDHKKEMISDARTSRPRRRKITLDEAKELTKPKEKTALQKQKAKEKKEEKEIQKKKEVRQIKKEAVKKEKEVQKKLKKKDIKDTLLSNIKNRKKKMPSISTQTETPKKKQVLKLPSQKPKKVTIDKSKKPPMNTKKIKITEEEKLYKARMDNFPKDIDKLALHYIHQIKKMDGGNSTQREAIFKKYEKRMYDYIGTEFEGKPINYEKFRKYFRRNWSNKIREAIPKEEKKVEKEVEKKDEKLKKQLLSFHKEYRNRISKISGGRILTLGKSPFNLEEIHSIRVDDDKITIEYTRKRVKKDGEKTQNKKTLNAVIYPKKTEEEEKKEEEKVEKKEGKVNIIFRNEGKTVPVRPLRTPIRSTIEKQYPDYNGYQRISLYNFQYVAMKEGKTATIEVLLKKNTDLKVQFGVKGSSEYGKVIILKKKKELKKNETDKKAGDEKDKTDKIDKGKGAWKRRREILLHAVTALKEVSEEVEDPDKDMKKQIKSLTTIYNNMKKGKFSGYTRPQRAFIKQSLESYLDMDFDEDDENIKELREAAKHLIPIFSDP